MSETPLSRGNRLRLECARRLGRFFLPGFSLVVLLLLRFGLRYRVDNFERVRMAYENATRKRRPILICPNHLTMIDSVVLQWILQPWVHYVMRYRAFPWNVPAVEHFASNPVAKIIAFLSKCIPIDRAGSPEHKAVVTAQIIDILRSGESFLVFPEGTRSRTGRVELDEITYGVGRIVQDVPGCLVFCVYLRGRRQITFSRIPARGETFHVAARMIGPFESKTGLRFQRDIARQIGTELISMENEFFEGQSALDRQ